MNVVKRVLVAITMVALTLGLASMPSLSTATAAPADQAACDAATADVVTAATAVGKAKNAKKKAKKKVKKAKQKLKAAKQAKAKVKVKKTKAKVKRAKKKFKNKKANLKRKKTALRNAQAAQDAKCADAPGGTDAFDFGALLALLTQAGGTDAGLPEIPGMDGGSPLDPTQLTGLLSMLSGGGDLPVDPSMLTDILAGFSSFDLDSFDPSQFADLLGGFSGGFDPSVFMDLLGGFSGGFDPSVFMDLLGGGAGLDPAVFMDLFATGLGALTGGGADLPFPTDPAAFLDLFQTGLGALTGQLDPGQLGDLLGLFGSFGGFGDLDPSSMGLEQLTGLLTGIFGGSLPTEFSPAVLQEMLAGFSGGFPTDPAAIAALFGGLFSFDQITDMMAGGASPEALLAAFEALTSQFGNFAGGDNPAGVLTQVITGLLDTLGLGAIGDVLETILGGLLGAAPGGGLPELPTIPGLPSLPDNPLCDFLPLPGLCA